MYMLAGDLERDIQWRRAAPLVSGKALVNISGQHTVRALIPRLR
ncbi:MAG: hypothetical protein AVDCRST_MAG87-3958 [uncultured Thermomicrobiales bacterium]|uniref:Uncharacterized protein n=1 Tax=uncultured Thermomicrobiales bacterium TaxID=1645740 RepID=A0A6J4VSY7_9BACT|nr:MAG: hypothetical protein AVDCRST_MAG87-3958 [uncultured Thermomicrobiales bacterium]